VTTECVELDFRIFLTGAEPAGGVVDPESSFPRELTLPKLDLDVDLLGGFVVGDGLVGSLALNCVLGKVLKRGEEG